MEGALGAEVVLATVDVAFVGDTVVCTGLSPSQALTEFKKETLESIQTR